MLSAVRIRINPVPDNDYTVIVSLYREDHSVTFGDTNRVCADFGFLIPSDIFSLLGAFTYILQHLTVRGCHVDIPMLIAIWALRFAIDLYPYRFEVDSLAVLLELRKNLIDNLCSHFDFGWHINLHLVNLADSA